MKKIILVFLILPIIAQAQTIQGSAYPATGTVETLIIADTAGVNPGAGGDGVTWDFSTLVNSGQVQTDSFLAPSNTPFGAAFPTATIVDHQQYPGTNYYIYYKDNGTELQRVGNVQPDTVVYYDPANQFPYPISFGSTNNDTYFASYNANGFLTHMRGDFSNTVDGRGTLKLPSGTFNNVIRVKFVRNEIDTAFSSPDITGTLSQTIYYWYQSSLYYPVLSITITTVSFNGMPSLKRKVIGYSGESAGITDYKIPFSSLTIFPNPANENMVINYGLVKSQDVSFSLFNLCGERVKQTANKIENSGKHQLKIGLKGIPSGIYILKSNSGERQKIIVSH